MTQCLKKFKYGLMKVVVFNYLANFKIFRQPNSKLNYLRLYQDDNKGQRSSVFLKFSVIYRRLKQISHILSFPVDHFKL